MITASAGRHGQARHEPLRRRTGPMEESSDAHLEESRSPARVIVTYVVEKGQPLATPVR